MRPTVPALLIGLATLSGCSLLHSNIRGGFACAAPKGTCAPSMRIDDAAIHEIGGQEGHDNEKPDVAGRTSGDTKAGSGASAAERGWVFVRGSSAAVKVVFPAWRDAAGRVHPRTSAYAAVDLPPMPNGDTAPIDGNRVGSADTGSLLAIAEMAPEIAALAAPPQAAGRSSESDGRQVSAPAEHGTVSGPSAALDSIKDQVKQILSTAGHAAGTAPPAKAGDSSAKPTASFPPAGN